MRRRLRMLVTAGPTREPVDPVRFLSNYSTGYAGACLATEALRRGHRVTVVSGPALFAPPRGARLIRVERARELQQVLRRLIGRADVLIMAAAVSDFEAARPKPRKLSRQGRMALELRATPDILGSLPRRPGQIFAGFALETGQGIRRARNKLRAKRLDLIVGQEMRRSDSPFGKRPVQAALLSSRDGTVRRLGRISKPRLARALLDEIEQLWYGGVSFSAK